MKTIQELYQEVLGSEKLKREFLSLKPEEVEGFAAKHGCEATLDEIKAFCEANQQNGELSDAELEQIAGGKGVDDTEMVWSIATFGLGCGMFALRSVVRGRCGTAIEGDRMLCEED